MPEKRALEEGLDLDIVKVYLLDIAGTIAPLSFVQDKLFKYITEHVEAYLDDNFEDEDCLADIEDLRAQCEKDVDEEGFVQIESSDKDKEVVLSSVVAYVQWLVSNNRSVAALKQLQGHMWEEAYSSGDIKGELFEDVHENLKKWVGEEKKVYIYSTGSIQSQKLLFQHSNEGDLNSLVSGYFDTTTGDKFRSESYTKIAEELNIKPEEILFLTDMAKEANAAKSAGLQVGVMTRPGNSALEEDEIRSWDTFNTFTDIGATEVTAKREKVLETEDEKNEEPTIPAEVAVGGE